MGAQNLIFILENAVENIEDGVDKLGLIKNEYFKQYVLSNFNRNKDINKELLLIKGVREEKKKPLTFK